MRRLLFSFMAAPAALLLSALALVAVLTVVTAAPALANGAYVEAVATVAAEDLDNYTDTAAGGGALGWDFGQYRLAAEYQDGQGGPETLAAMAYVDFGDGAFQPFMGAGAGAIVEDISSLEFGDPVARAAAGLSYGWDHVRILGGYSYTAEFDALGDGDGRIFAGLRIGF